MKPLTVAQIEGLKKDPLLYESAKNIVDAHNQVVSALQRGDDLQQGNFTFVGMGAGAKVSAVAGGMRRGTFTLTIGTAPSANPSVTLTFPVGFWKKAAMVLVVRNGGTGVKSHTWTVSDTKLMVTLAGTPTAGETYIFSFSAEE
jgi:hypothetical protein